MTDRLGGKTSKRSQEEFVFYAYFVFYINHISK